jgi:hypothetical protein
MLRSKPSLLGDSGNYADDDYYSYDFDDYDNDDDNNNDNGNIS